MTIVAIALFLPFICAARPVEPNWLTRMPPSAGHLTGGDLSGRDIFGAGRLQDMISLVAGSARSSCS
ncbi:MAG: hypothetical protein U0869_04680 [Chloroflexota bacterium]